MRFFKYRKCWAWGNERWKYCAIYVETDGGVKDYFEDLTNDSNWSDKFRGMDWEEEVPPDEWFEKEIKEQERTIKGIRSYIKDLKNARTNKNSFNN